MQSSPYRLFITFFFFFFLPWYHTQCRAHTPSGLQLLFWSISDLPDLGDVLAHLHTAALWAKTLLQKDTACAAVDSKKSPQWVWISVLGLVPGVAAAATGWEVSCFYCLPPAEGGVLKSWGVSELCVWAATPWNQEHLRKARHGLILKRALTICLLFHIF